MKINPLFKSFYYANVENYPKMEINLSETALCIVDLQKGFAYKNIGDALIAKKEGDYERWIPFYDRIEEIVIPNNEKILKYFRTNNMQVTFGRIACYLPDGADRSPVQKSDGWNNIFFHKDSVEAEMVDEVMPLPTELVWNKTTDGLVAGTNYSRILRNMGIKTVVVTGLVTDQCVANTVRQLADDDFQVICVHDACAAGDIELHNFELKIMNLIYCQVHSTEDLLELLEQSKGHK